MNNKKRQKAKRKENKKMNNKKRQKAKREENKKMNNKKRQKTQQWNYFCILLRVKLQEGCLDFQS